ncbi:MAG TPA: tRNA adenosine(34) deaminase TadA [Candidatus Saccharicenans sp.]|nr:tRNA adenosine(34) deaminase TadA [Candidatus Saccharicenans sp.]
MEDNGDRDTYFMKKALEQAGQAAAMGEVPVGAVVVKDGKIIARGYNQSISRSDPSAHAEIIALKKAAKTTKNYRLIGLTLYVTVEPCPMCFGAILQARIKRLVYGTKDSKQGAVVSRLAIPLENANHRVEIHSGVLSEECRQLMSDFFQTRRQAKKQKRKVENSKEIK